MFALLVLLLMVAGSLLALGDCLISLGTGGDWPNVESEPTEPPPPLPAILAISLAALGCRCTGCATRDAVGTPAAAALITSDSSGGALGDSAALGEARATSASAGGALVRPDPFTGELMPLDDELGRLGFLEDALPSAEGGVRPCMSVADRVELVDTDGVFAARDSSGVFGILAPPPRDPTGSDGNLPHELSASPVLNAPPALPPSMMSGISSVINCSSMGASPAAISAATAPSGAEPDRTIELRRARASEDSVVFSAATALLSSCVQACLSAGESKTICSVSSCTGDATSVESRVTRGISQPLITHGAHVHA